MMSHEAKAHVPPFASIAGAALQSAPSRCSPLVHALQAHHGRMTFTKIYHVPYPLLFYSQIPKSI